MWGPNNFCPKIHLLRYVSWPPATSANIAEDAIEGKILVVILIPVFQTVFLKVASTLQTIPSPENALIDPVGYAYMIVGILGIFSIGLTVASVVGSCLIAGIPGVFAYFVFDLLIAMLLNSVTIAALVFVVGIPTFACIIWLNRRMNGPAHPARGMHR